MAFFPYIEIFHVSGNGAGGAFFFAVNFGGRMSVFGFAAEVADDTFTWKPPDPKGHILHHKDDAVLARAIEKCLLENFVAIVAAARDGRGGGRWRMPLE